MEKILEPDEELKKEIIKKFSPKREASELLSASYQRLGYGSKFERVKGCGTYLEFWRAVSDNPEKWRLHSANFCRDRLCPLGVPTRFSGKFRRLWTLSRINTHLYFSL